MDVPTTKICRELELHTKFLLFTNEALSYVRSVVGNPLVTQITHGLPLFIDGMDVKRVLMDDKAVVEIFSLMLSTLVQKVS